MLERFDELCLDPALTAGRAGFSCVSLYPARGVTRPGGLEVVRKLWRVVRGVLKWSGITALGLLALALLLFAVAFLINARDEEPGRVSCAF
jgi:hypothetical protein